ncbi:hypothetical protein [Aurantibacillus circumpalustris]|uniref:hypothetical protein n=1 Tax=Aurantibacillus circumpalustris TaxID=3036359 RepID=UPI00295B8D6E|nr:hypothetical protein [Aurantibacillus circumpalustris]
MGNLIQDKNGNLEKVSSLQVLNDVLEKINDDPYPGFYQPIKLTEGFLLTFGFEKRGVEWCLSKSIIDFYYGNEDKSSDVDAYISIDVNEGSHGAEPLLHILYVHQLQNLYYALIGEELELPAEHFDSEE